MNLIEDLIKEVKNREEAGIPVNRIPEVIDALNSRRDKINTLFGKIKIDKEKEKIFEAQNRFKEKIELAIAFGGSPCGFKGAAKKALKQYYEEIGTEEEDA